MNQYQRNTDTEYRREIISIIQNLSNEIHNDINVGNIPNPNSILRLESNLIKLKMEYGV